jgi:hypothetical protein
MHNPERRVFFGDLLRHVVHNATSAFREGMEEQRRLEDLEQFFESYESSYALTLCYPDDILMETARSLGILCEGREKIDIVKELILTKGGF